MNHLPSIGHLPIDEGQTNRQAGHDHHLIDEDGVRIDPRLDLIVQAECNHPIEETSGEVEVGNDLPCIDLDHQRSRDDDRWKDGDQA